MQICSLINFPHVKFPPAKPPSTPLKKPPKNSSTQKSIFKLLKPQIEQTLVLSEFLPPPAPPFFFWLSFFWFFFGESLPQYTKIPKNIKNDISITWNLVQEKVLHEEIIAYFELRMACQIAPFVYLVIMHLFVPPLFFLFYFQFPQQHLKRLAR
jgi:hypothetical protein